MKPILLILIFSILFSQEYSITGKVLDIKTGKAIEFVNVYKENSTFGNTTNTDGLFDIYGLSKGKHTIIASYEGYMTQRKTVELSESQKTIYIEFKLFEKVIQDSTVIVEAKRIGKLKIKSTQSLVKIASKPPKRLNYPNNGLPVVNVINFENFIAVEDRDWTDWLSDNYTYIIIGATAIIIGVAAF